MLPTRYVLFRNCLSGVIQDLGIEDQTIHSNVLHMMKHSTKPPQTAEKKPEAICQKPKWIPLQNFSN